MTIQTPRPALAPPRAPIAESTVTAPHAVAAPTRVAVASRLTPTQRPRSPLIRVGLSTRGGPITLMSRSTLLISDAAQAGRRLAVGPGDTATFSLGKSATVTARGQQWSGPVQIRTGSGVYPGWRVVAVVAAGGPTHVATNGSDPRRQRAYYGSFEIAPQTYSFEPATHKSTLRLVNVLWLDEYLKGVVPWEMNASAPLEALKAQAICARSEATAKIQAGRHKLDGFDICDYDHCQGYVGTENVTAWTSRAVDETAGQVILYNGRIADAVYGTNSGGITAAAEDVWHGRPEPYLRSVHDFGPRQGATAQVVKPRMTEDDWVRYCTQNLPSYAQPSTAQLRHLASRRRAGSPYQDGDLPEFYRWTRVVTPRQLSQSAGARVTMDTVTEIRVLLRAPSGHIKQLWVRGLTPPPTTGAPGVPISVTLDGDSEIRAMLSGRLGSTTALPSSTFVVLLRRDSKGTIIAFVLKGAGWGHGAGMCQRGAQNHARDGWTAQQIIHCYFHGVELRKIY